MHWNYWSYQFIGSGTNFKFYPHSGGQILYKVPFDQIYRVPSQPDPVKENLTSEDDEDTCPIPAHISAPEAPMEIPIPDEIMQVPTEEETSCVMEQLPVETPVVVDDTMEHISNDVEDALQVDMFVPRRLTRISRRPKHLEDKQ